jgi:putative copper resistance protein D
VTDPLVFFRALHIAATVLAFGTVAFMALVAKPGLATDGQATALRGLRRTCNGMTWAALAVALLAVAGWLVWLAADIDGEPVIAVALRGDFWTVLTQTRFGFVTILRVALAALLAVLMPWPATRALQIAIAGGLLGLLALVGHAGATPGAVGVVHLASDMLHLLAAGAWLGGLPALAVVLARARRSEQAATLRFATAVTRRFSRLGLVCVPALFATGIINCWNLMSGPRDLVTTDYGRLVLLKIGLFGAMTCIAAANRLHVTPRLPAAGALGALLRNTLAETGLGLCALLAVGVLGTLSPSSHHHGTGANVPSNAAFVHIHSEAAMAEVAIEPGRIGQARARIRVFQDDFSEYPARSVELSLVPPKPGAAITHTARHAPNGGWAVNALDLLQPGVWTVRVVISGPGREPITLDAPIVIENK